MTPRWGLERPEGRRLSTKMPLLRGSIRFQRHRPAFQEITQKFVAHLQLVEENFDQRETGMVTSLSSDMATSVPDETSTSLPFDTSAPRVPRPAPTAAPIPAPFPPPATAPIKAPAPAPPPMKTTL